jgi:uncharacterized protein involved in exopolysaccharide biosynthesis
MSKIYRATTYLLVSESKIGAASQNAAWQYALIRTYLPFVDSDAVLAETIRHFRLDQPPYSLTVETFRKRGYLDVDVPRSTRLVEINIDFPDAHLAANIANYVAECAGKLNDQLTASDTKTTEGFLKARMEEARAKLARAEAERLEVKKRARIEEKEKQLGILLNERASISGELAKLLMATAQNDARARTLQEELNKEPEFFRLRKDVTSDPFLLHLVEKLSGSSPDESNLTVTEEAVNPTREELRKEYANAKAGAQENQAAFQAGMNRLQHVEASTGKLLADVTVGRSEIDRVEREYALAKEAHETTSRDYLNASVTVSSKSQDLKQLAPAVVPERPVKPRIFLNTVLAAFFGFTLSALASLAWESFQEVRSRVVVAVGENDCLIVREG